MSDNPGARRARSPRLLTLVAAGTFVLAACSSGAATTPAPSAGSTVSPTPSPAAPSRVPVTPDPTRPAAATAPARHLAIPGEFAEPMPPGRYWSAPPFDLGFAFELDVPGWRAGHLNPEFVDLQQFEGTPGEDLPTRIVGFAHPLEIHGAEIVDAADLSPADAVALWVARTDIEAANVTDVDLLGGEAVRVDVHTPISMLALFGGDDGTFRLDREMDVRIVVVAVDGGLFLATVHAVPAELDAAWEEALPILESIALS